MLHLLLRLGDVLKVWVSQDVFNPKNEGESVTLERMFHRLELHD